MWSKQGSMRFMVGAVMMGALVATAPALHSADEEKPSSEVVTAKAQKSRGAGEDENIKVKQGKNEPEAPGEPAPAEKGGEKTRGGACRVHFDNSTPWYVSVYVDGAYQGQVGPYGDAVEYYGGSSGTIYARADFTDGTFVYWGPQHAVCAGGQYYYRMTR